MIEAFKEVKVFTSKKLNFKSKFLITFNIFFPFIDLALLIFIPLGIILLIFNNHLLMGWLSLLVLLSGLVLCLIIEIRRKLILKVIKCQQQRRSFFAFVIYILLYAFLLAPYCICGYISELVNSPKKW